MPVGFKATDDVLDRLKSYFGVEDVRGVVNRLPVDTYGAFNNAFYGVWPQYVGGPQKVLYPQTYPDGTWDSIYGYKRRWAPVVGGWTDELVPPPPLADACTVEEVARHQWPVAEWFDYSTLAEQCERVAEYAVVFNVGGIGNVANLIGHERYYTDLYLNPQVLQYAIERIMDFYVAFTDRVLSAASGRVDIVMIQDDFGTQRSPLLSVDMFRQFWKPQLKRFFGVAKRHGVKGMMHSCGAVFDFIPEFIEIGADVLDPVQTTSCGMDPERLKKQYGGQICFHGGIDTQNLLVNGSAADIRRHVDTLVDSFGADGGFILAPSHYLQPDAPLGNVLTLFEHIAELRGDEM